MPDYDAVADRYDHHFHRPQDRWEDERLASLLRPYVEGRHVLDLGCGTGWLLDHLSPASYLGVDESMPMLERLAAKHPTALTHKATIGEPGWADLPWRVDTIAATWSAHDLGNLRALLVDCLDLLDGAGTIALHGQAPRYRHRHHYVLDGLDDERGYLRWRPDLCRLATPPGLRHLGCHGVGAWPDGWPPLRPLWALGARLAPVEAHYSFLSIWEA